MKIALVAEEAAGLRALKMIVAGGHELASVFCSHEESAGSEHPIAVAAATVGAEVRRAELVRSPEVGSELRARGVDVLLNVHSLHVIDSEVLAAPRVGAFNLHPGPLPEYAGLNTVSWAIYDGATEYGSTLHWMVPLIDAGPVAYQTRFGITPDVSAARLTARCVREGLALVGRLLETLARGESPPRMPQDLTRREYFGRIIPNEGRIDWRTQSARAIVTFVRACDYGPFPSPWGHPRARIAGKDVEITRAALTGAAAQASAGTIGGRSASDGILIAALDEWIDVQSVRIGGRDMPAKVLVTEEGVAEPL